jgi:glycerophosphoryl diester phosphodiesterase
VNIELKPPQGASYSERSAISCAALGMVRSRGLMDSTIFTSFDHGLLRLIRRLEPGAILGVLTEEATDLDARDLVFEIEAASFNPRASTLTPQVVQVMHSANALVMCWAGEGENIPEQMRCVLKMGADGFFADDVNLLRAEIEKLKSS